MTAPGQLLLAEQHHFWVGVERRTVAAGTVVYGQMYVFAQVPAEVRHAYPVVCVHGGAGQGLAYLGPGEGRPGWAHYLVQEGYVVYVVDRPGHGRSPHHLEVLGPMTGPIAYERLVPMLTAGKPGGHWPGTGEIGDPTVDQFMAAHGPMMADNSIAHGLWQSRGVELLERIGPAIIMTHSAGGPFGWLVGDARPDLVKGIVAIEAGGPQHTAIPLSYDPPISRLDELAMETISPKDKPPYQLQAEPARPLVNLRRVPIATVRSDDSSFDALTDATVAYLRQGGCTVDDVRLADHGVRGNGHFMMLEDNNRQVFDVVLSCIEGLERSFA